MLLALYPRRGSDDTSGPKPRRRGAALALLGLIGTAGCGGGGGTGSGQPSTQRPTALALGTPTAVTGRVQDGLTFTFSETLTTISGSPAVTFALHEANNGADAVTVSAASDPATRSLFPTMAVQALDPQGNPVSLPPVTGFETLTLAPGDTADVSQTFNVAHFPLPGRYTVTVSATGTQGVTALAGPIVFSAD